MIRLPDPKTDIPEQLMSDNWAFHILARSDDPAYKCQNIGNLVNNLVATLSIAGLLDTEINYSLIIQQNNKNAITNKTIFFKTVNDFMKFQVVGANKSWNLYSKGERGEAVEIAGAVLREVLPLVYDIRFTTPHSNSFAARERT
jgi:hypothetical protein